MPWLDKSPFRDLRLVRNQTVIIALHGCLVSFEIERLSHRPERSCRPIVKGHRSRVRSGKFGSKTDRICKSQMCQGETTGFSLVTHPLTCHSFSHLIALRAIKWIHEEHDHCKDDTHNRRPFV